MEVIALTLLVSLILAGIFVCLFVWSTRFGRTPEQDSLLPLEEEDFSRERGRKKPQTSPTARSL